MIKIKPKGFELWQGLNSLAQAMGGSFADIYSKCYETTEICNAEKKTWQFKVTIHANFQFSFVFDK